MRNLIRLLSMCLMGALAASAVGEEPGAAPVVVNRPYLPGRVYEVEFSYDHTISSSGGRIDRQWASNNKAEHYALSGKVSDAELDPTGYLRALRFTIARLTNEGRDAIRPGSICRVENAKDKIVVSSADGQAIPDNAKPMLQRMFTTSDLHRAEFDSAMRSQTVRKVGDSWPMDSKAIMDWEVGNLSVGAVAGTCTLKEGPAGSHARRLESAITVKDANDPVAPPQGFMLEDSLSTRQTLLLLPDDTSRPAPEYEWTYSRASHYSTIGGTAGAWVKQYTHFKQKIKLADEKAVVAGAAATRPG
jgi:hypothetical protein